MEKVLYWEKIPKAMATEEWMKISADGAPPGVYRPNMSEEDMLKWKAKIILGDDPRVEIRKTFHWVNDKPYPKGKNYAAQVLIQVRINPKDEPETLISTNGKIAMTSKESVIQLAIEEAKYALIVAKSNTE